MTQQYSVQLKVKTMTVREATGVMVSQSNHVANFLSDIANAAQEMMFVITLNTKNNIIDKHLVSMGTLSESLVHPREIFRPAISDSAKSIILAHNHPSGDITPSTQDNQITQRIKAAGELLGVDLLDHIIIGNKSYYSYADERTL